MLKLKRYTDFNNLKSDTKSNQTAKPADSSNAIELQQLFKFLRDNSTAAKKTRIASK